MSPHHLPLHFVVGQIAGPAVVQHTAVHPLVVPICGIFNRFGRFFQSAAFVLLAVVAAGDVDTIKMSPPQFKSLMSPSDSVPLLQCANRSGKEFA